jgi:Ala-tRNA(Pro) deacylase
MTAKSTSTRSILEEAGIEFEQLAHAHTETALAEARALGVPASTVAKTVVVKTQAGSLRAVLPATERLDLGKVRRFLGLEKADVRLLSEDELAREYPEFELGAVPPFGGMSADRVLVDRRLVDQEQLVLEAGSHEDSLRLASRDLVRMTRADVVDICEDE